MFLRKLFQTRVSVGFHPPPMVLWIHIVDAAGLERCPSKATHALFLMMETLDVSGLSRRGSVIGKKPPQRNDRGQATGLDKQRLKIDLMIRGAVNKI